MPRSTKAARAYGSSSGTRATKSAMNSSRCNQNQGGGDKKQGLLSVVGNGQFSLWNGRRRAGSTPETRRKVFCLNQLGGVGSGFYQTSAPSDGVKRPCKGSKEDEKVPVPKKLPAVSNYIADALMEFLYPKNEPNNQLRVLLQSLYLKSIIEPLKAGLVAGDGAGAMKAKLNGLPSIAQRAFQPGSVVIPMLLGKDVLSTSTTFRASLSDNMLIARFTTNSVDFIYKGASFGVSDYMYLDANVDDATLSGNAPTMFGLAQDFSQNFAAATNKAGAAVIINALNTINTRSLQFDSFNNAPATAAERELKDVTMYYDNTNSQVLMAGVPQLQTRAINPQSFMNALELRLNDAQLGDISTQPDFALVIGRVEDLNNYFIEEKWKEAGNNASFNGYTMNTDAQAPVNPAPYVSPSPGIGSLPLSFAINGINMSAAGSSGYYPIPSPNTLLALLNKPP